MDILIKTGKGNGHLRAALDHAATLPRNNDDNWPYVPEQRSERFIFVTKQDPGYRIGLYAKGTDIRPRIIFPYNMTKRWAPIAEFVADVILTSEGATLKVKLKRSTLILYGTFTTLVLAFTAYPDGFGILFGLFFIAITFPFIYSELKKGRTYFIERVSEYLQGL